MDDFARKTFPEEETRESAGATAEAEEQPTPIKEGKRNEKEEE